MQRLNVILIAALGLTGQLALAQGMPSKPVIRNATASSTPKSVVKSKKSLAPVTVYRSHYALPEAYKMALPTKTVKASQVVAMNESPLPLPVPEASSSISKPDSQPPKKNIELGLGMLIEGQSRRDDKSERQDVVHTALTTKLRWNLTEWTSVDVQPKFRFKTGHIQGASPTNGRESTVALNRAEFIFSDRNFFELGAGVMDNSGLQSTLLMDMSLPGFRGLLSTGEKNPLAVAGFVIGGVPGSSTQTDVSDELNKTPSYVATGLRAQFKNDTLKTSLSGSTFQFQNLPTSIAKDSITFGNTNAEGSIQSPIQRLLYQYRGVEAHARLDWKITPRLEWKNAVAAARNSEAPDELNFGYSFRTEAEFAVNNEWLLIPSYAYFNVQPDAVVANFNDELITTNRIGYLGGLFVQYKKMFKIGGVAGERTVIFESAPQGRESYVGISVEALDVSF